MHLNDIVNRFQYHPPKNDSVADLHGSVRQGCLSLATEWNEFLPPGREASLAVTKLEEAMFWANAAIARNN